MIDQKPTKITLEALGHKHSSELSWDAGIVDILDAFYGMCISATFHPETILSNMQEWLDEKKSCMAAFKENDEEN